MPKETRRDRQPTRHHPPSSPTTMGQHVRGLTSHPRQGLDLVVAAQARACSARGCLHRALRCRDHGRSRGKHLARANEAGTPHPVVRQKPRRTATVDSTDRSRLLRRSNNRNGLVAAVLLPRRPRLADRILGRHLAVRGSSHQADPQRPTAQDTTDVRRPLARPDQALKYSTEVQQRARNGPSLRD